jgi:hypothetical protein
VATLGVPWTDYVGWQLLSITNLILAPILMLAGIGWFRRA